MIAGHAFEMRLFVLVASCDPLLAYSSRLGWARFTADRCRGAAGA